MKNSLYLLLFSIFAFACTDLSEDVEEPSNYSCESGYPKVFGNQKYNTLQIDVFHYQEGELEYVRSIFPRIEFPNRMITLLDETTMEDTYQGNEFSYSLNNGCIADNRSWQRNVINGDCSVINSDFLMIGVNSNGLSWTDGKFDCFKEDSVIINEAIDFFETFTTFDSVYIDRRSEVLSIID